MREGDAGRNVPLSASGFALGTSPQRGEEPLPQRGRFSSLGSSPLWGEVPSAARRRGVYLIGEADE